MADGFDIHLDAQRAARLRARAAEAGLEPAAYALSVLDEAVGDDWGEDRRRLAEYDRTGECVSVEEALADFKHDMDTRLAALK